MQSFQGIVEEMNVILTQKTIWLVFIRDEVSSRRKMKWTHEKMQIIDKIKIYSSYKARGKYSQKWVLFCITTRSVSYCLLFSFIVWIFFLFPSSSFVSCCILSCSQPVLLGFFSSGFYHFWFFFLFSIQFVYIALSIDLSYHASHWPSHSLILFVPHRSFFPCCSTYFLPISFLPSSFLTRPSYFPLWIFSILSTSLGTGQRYIRHKISSLFHFQASKKSAFRTIQTAAAVVR